jgi:hypothetical protein
LDDLFSAGAGAEYRREASRPLNRIAREELLARDPTVEHAAIAGPQHIVSDLRTDNEPSGVGIPMNRRGRVHHTHPGTLSPLSLPDLVVSLKRLQMHDDAESSTMFAHQTRGGGSVLRFSKKLEDPANRKRLVRAIHAALKRAERAWPKDDAGNPLKTGVWGAHENKQYAFNFDDNARNLIIGRALRRAGILDRFSYAPGSRRQARVLRRYEWLLRDIENQAMRPLRAIHPDLNDGLPYPLTREGMIALTGASAGTAAAVAAAAPSEPRPTKRR